MEANNRKCGVGIAFEASIGGIKLLDGLMNDRVEGEALSYKQELIDIYSASWGPSDDGKTLDGPRRLAVEALKRGVTKVSLLPTLLLNIRIKIFFLDPTKEFTVVSFRFEGEAGTSKII